MKRFIEYSDLSNEEVDEMNNLLRELILIAEVAKKPAHRENDE